MTYITPAPAFAKTFANARIEPYARAGPVRGGRVQTTNLAWPVDAASGPALPDPVLPLSTRLASAEMAPGRAVNSDIPAPLPLPSANACTDEPLDRTICVSPRNAMTPPEPEP